jgi:AraC-like DNA-binding protein
MEDPPRPDGSVAAWRPPVDGVHEVLHARFGDHAYPMHAHGTWTVLLVDDGAVRHEDFEASCRLSLVTERLTAHLRRADAPPPAASAGRGTARQFRELLDAHVSDGLTLAAASQVLQRPPARLVRTFRQEYGLPPHRYLTGRRVELARRHLLAGHPAARAAVLAGFYDQAHLTRHFTRLLGVTPARYAGGPRAG